MSTLTPEELRAHLGDSSSVGDEVLQDVIDDLDAEILSRFGPVGPAVEVEEIIRPYEWNGPIALTRKPASIVSVVERLDSAGSSTRTLSADDWRRDGYLLYRLTGGTTPAYGFSSYGVVVRYVPEDDTARRKMAIVDAAKVELAHSGYISLRIGDYAESTGSGGQGQESLEAKRNRILRRLAPRKGVILK